MDYPTRPLPRFFKVRQDLPRDRVADVVASRPRRAAAPRPRARLKRGASVAITAGSRGIADIPLVLRTVADCVREAGAEPFIVPAMGSHGGATPEGQRHVLAEYGITEASVGAPIRATMDTVELGRLPSGAQVHFDALAAAADATIVVNRVKAHTAFRGDIESGLCKMTCIGLGKQRGAEQTHDHGLRETIPAAAALSLERNNVVAGLALVENAAHELAHVRGVAPHDFLEADRELLAWPTSFCRACRSTTCTSWSSAGWARTCRAVAWTTTWSACGGASAASACPLLQDRRARPDPRVRRQRPGRGHRRLHHAPSL